MTEDELMTELAKVIRSEDAVDARLEGLLSGRATEEELRALHASAQNDVELARQIEAFRPLSEQALTRLDAIAGPKRTVRYLPWLAGAGTLTALAAGVLLSVQPASLPTYVLDLRAGDALERSAMRSGDGEVRSMRADSTLQMILRPASSVDGPVEGRAFVIPASGRSSVRRVPVEVLNGAARLMGTAEEVTGLAEGSATIILLVGRRGFLPDLTEVRALSASNRVEMDGKGYRGARLGVRIHPAPGAP